MSLHRLPRAAPRMLLVAAVLVSAWTACAPGRDGAAAAIAQTPNDGVSGVIEALDRHPVVGIGDFHGLQQLAEFYAALVRDPRFTARGRTLVVEFGNGLFQGVIDRYVAGEPVPSDSVRAAWKTAPGWRDVPEAYGGIFAAVRAANQNLPEDRRIRVLLGDPPHEPGRPVSVALLGSRDEFFADRVREGLESHGSVLAIVGSSHLKENPQPGAGPGAPGSGPTMVPLGAQGGVPPAPGSSGPTMVPLGPGGPGGAPGPVRGGSAAPAANVRRILAPTTAIYTIQVHTGAAPEACNAALEEHLKEWPTPGFGPVDSTLASLLDADGCTSIVPDFVARPGSSAPITRPRQAWADAYLYLGPVEHLAISPAEPGRPPQPLREWAARLAPPPGSAP